MGLLISSTLNNTNDREDWRKKKHREARAQYGLYEQIMMMVMMVLQGIVCKMLLVVKSASVVSGYRARLENQGSRVQTQLSSMDFFRT